MLKVYMLGWGGLFAAILGKAREEGAKIQPSKMCGQRAVCVSMCRSYCPLLARTENVGFWSKFHYQQTVWLQRSQLVSLSLSLLV